MGASESKSSNGEDRAGEEQFHTPIANRRVQKLSDPRSPTDDVQRTPMQRSVDDDDDFVDPRSPTSIARTPVPDDSDPRSPTGGREPGPFVFPLPSDDPRSPSRIVARTPICKDAPKEFGIETVTVHQADDHIESSENSSNNNQQVSSNDDIINDNTKLSTSEDTESGVFQIETDKTNLVETEESENANCDEGGQQLSGQRNVNPPEYEMELTKMLEKQTIANEESDNQDGATLVLSDRGKETSS